MTVRTIVLGISLVVLLYATSPLVAGANQAPDICCSSNGECPDGLRCIEGSTCDPESPGYCIPIEQDGD